MHAKLESWDVGTKVELEGSDKATDNSLKQLLRSLSLYGHQQPMSREEIS